MQISSAKAKATGVVRIEGIVVLGMALEGESLNDEFTGPFWIAGDRRI